ncbi:CDP-glycerol glycerophosphotransferase family protein [Clostridioides sp. ES-S-0108-01]|uniref:bifunctional glycosyltransferase/CDP-glycerol:glycerophosphate glycerophosphotransferase n=1 Tax=Clostridioides sp. ES-S-0108-01 TaxID=2770773 RepID=UPI001D0CBD43|nr:CDP-glycerol glycerophosphotransferase family protein [Clostridioides sp. ES-S-0108-01]UDN50434.1 CDP-glycerol glycerophosphotransferase family protein [Clostridioides sp. ES-S-0107-01]
MNDYDFKFSIVIPVYNSEKYLECTIRSIVNQEKINFEADVQIILVNDGSLDNSEEICLKYKDLYPNNIVYIYKENGGVSSARNKGIELAEGKYINFLDSDDKFDENVLVEVYSFFEDNYEDIDFVSIPLYFFDLENGEHILNEKFNKNRVIDIFKEYKSIQLSASSSFFKKDITKKMLFDENLSYAEDAKFITKILLEKGKFGIVSNAKYFYRRRGNLTSAIQNGVSRKEWYNEYIINFSIDILNYSKTKFGFIPKYVQYLVMYDLQWRFIISNLSNDIFNDEEIISFKENIKYVLSDIDDSIIIQQKYIYLEHKLFCMNLKYGNNLRLNKINDKCDIYYGIHDSFIYKLSDFKPKIDFMHIDNNKLIIEGFLADIKLFKTENITIIAKANSEIYKAEILDNVKSQKHSLDEVIMEKKYFLMSIPLLENVQSTEIELFIKSNETEIKIKPNFNKFVRLFSDVEKSYFIDNGFCVVYQKGRFSVIRKTLKSKLGREVRFIQELYRRKQYKIVILRIFSYILKNIKRKEIWLIMDRVDMADDNGEALFRYTLNKKDNIKKYFVIDKKSKDYKRIKKLGKVLNFNSYRHKLFLILADKVISSHIEDNIRCGLESGGRYLKNLIDFKFVFLQHGIIKDDLSSWLNRYNKNINLFITSAEQEYDAILNENYYYNKDIVKLTGLARYDYLHDSNKKQIVISPTWRKNIVNNLNINTGKREYNENFKESIYFKVYNKLINDKKLIEYAKTYGYSIVFFPHPNIEQQLKDFKQNDFVLFKDKTTTYNKLFSESSLFITDYSSVVFDFAFLKKAVIYYQYDKGEIFEDGTHTYKRGYFDYDTMGFGEVCYEYNDLINLIIEYIENNCEMKTKYINRVNNFYRYVDAENCQRIYDEIKKI